MKAKRVYVGGQGEGHFCWGPLRAGSLEAEPEGGGGCLCKTVTEGVLAGETCKSESRGRIWAIGGFKRTLASAWSH